MQQTFEQILLSLLKKYESNPEGDVEKMIAEECQTQGISEASVEVVTQSFSDPVHTNGGQQVADAFMRIYGVDIKRAGALNGVYLNVDRIG